MKVNQRVENIFAHAVALQQNGRLRNTIYCKKMKIYIVNQDQTVILQFRLREGEEYFDTPVSFAANDYDSKNMEERDGKICFLQNDAGFDRVKSCKTPRMDTDDVDEMFRGFKLTPHNKVSLHKNILSLLEDNLSHIEFAAVDGKLIISQRNIYSGSVISLTREKAKGLGFQETDKLDDFAPIGLRTNDFIALFSFVDHINFYFPIDQGYAWAKSRDKKMKMKVIISKCVYDELGGTHGREK